MRRAVTPRLPAAVRSVNLGRSAARTPPDLGRIRSAARTTPSMSPLQWTAGSVGVAAVSLHNITAEAIDFTNPRPTPRRVAKWPSMWIRGIITHSSGLSDQSPTPFPAFLARRYRWRRARRRSRPEETSFLFLHLGGAAGDVDLVELLQLSEELWQHS